jgi:putative flippase GtrA
MPYSFLPQLMRYATVGLAAAVAHYGMLFALVQSGATGDVVGTLAGFIAGGIVSYLLNRRFTFVSDRHHGAAMPRFVAIAFGGFLLTGALMWLLSDQLGLYYMLAQPLITVIVMVWTFIGNRFWTFAESAVP